MEQRQRSQTRSGLLPEATHVILPNGISSTGFPATEATCRQIGISFDPWQADLNRAILAKDADGMYAADTVVLSIPRQVGKTFDVGGLVFADSIINAKTTTVWTAHRFKVARESFNEMRAWAKSPPLKQHIDYDDITTAAGNECIPFRNGSRIVFAARERGAIRGFTKVRRLILDEAQILAEHALSDLVPTMNQAENPQLVLMGTPPKPTDPGEVFTRLRAEALDGDAEGVLYVEFSAPPGSSPDDRGAWRTANPSYPRRTPAKAILRMRKILSAEDFMREALGVWDESGSGGPISAAVWAALADPDSAAGDRLVFGISASPRGIHAAIGVAGKRDDGLGHVELIDHRQGTGWVVDRVAGEVDVSGTRTGGLVDRWKPLAIVIDPGGPAGYLIAELEEALTDRETGEPRTQLIKTSARDVAQATDGFIAACGVAEGDEATLRVRPHPALDVAVKETTTRPLGDGRKWQERTESADISPLRAVTLARWGLVTAEDESGAAEPWVMYG